MPNNQNFMMWILKSTRRPNPTVRNTLPPQLKKRRDGYLGNVYSATSNNTVCNLRNFQKGIATNCKYYVAHPMSHRPMYEAQPSQRNVRR